MARLGGGEGAWTSKAERQDMRMVGKRGFWRTSGLDTGCFGEEPQVSGE